MKKYVIMMVLAMVLGLVGTVPVALAADAAAVAKAEMLHLNKATAEQLQALPGVGPALSARIVAYREQHGPFKKVEELTLVKGVGERSLEKFRALVIID